ncbi:MAG: hypothetical protein LBJ15_06520 [Comamonas sp.]|jgi:hypothetical protein|uniref:hypothetical protein n=1 Tax=Comamonas sp. TaxID=34028 RepID=UPI00281C06BB|nr:hypothetical protein [Comamonas sp.]MDR0213647.1 hypothetical protein [Comamonas sp.]MDR2299091.1 hypothetical protein [Comamonas sp.]
MPSPWTTGTALKPAAPLSAAFPGSTPCSLAHIQAGYLKNHSGHSLAQLPIFIGYLRQNQPFTNQKQLNTKDYQQQTKLACHRMAQLRATLVRHSDVIKLSNL